MSNHTDTVTEQEKYQQRRGRIQGVIIMLVVLLPMIIAYIIFYTGLGMPAGTINNGDLLSPPQLITDLPLQTMENTDWDFDAQPKKWRLLIPGYRECAEQCKKNLYLTRQVHIRLAEKSARVERLYLLLNNQNQITQSTADFLATEHPYVPVVKVAEQDFKSLLARTDIPANALVEGRYFLMDQEGFIMMSYTPQHEGKELLEDIKRMLKYSYEE